MATKKINTQEAPEKKRTSRLKKPAKATPSPKETLSPEALAQRKKMFRDILWVLVGLVSIFVFISIIFPDSTGDAGRLIHNTFELSFGKAAYLLPLLAIYAVLHSIFRFTDLGAHWVVFLALILHFDACLILNQLKMDGGYVGALLGDTALAPFGFAGQVLVSMGIALISLMILTRLSLKQIYNFVKPPLLYMAKLAKRLFKGLYSFLTFGQDDDSSRKLHESTIQKVPDLSSLVKPPKEAVLLNVDEDEDDEEEDEDEDDEETEEKTEESDLTGALLPKLKPVSDEALSSKENSLPKAPDTAETRTLDFPTVSGPALLVGTPDGKPGGYEQLTPKETPKPETGSASLAVQYELPPLSLLKKAEKEEEEKSARDYSELLEETLADFGVEVKVINKVRGPTVTRYELQPAKGVKVKKVTSLANDIALALAAYSIRIEAPIPGKAAIGIEVPNHRIDPVFLRDILYKAKYKALPPLSLALGMDITGKAITADLLKMPHLLIAGSTGSGKSVCINCVIASILYKATPYDVQMVMVDPKRVELSLFEGIPHLVDIRTDSGKKIITNPKTATLALKTVSEIMDQRYEDFVALKVRNIKEYNERAEVKIPYIVIVIDELADLMMVSSSTVEQYICRIAQLGRASGIHMIVATQRPSVNVITGLIKANIPSRIAFAVSSQVDSRTILDRVGAEKLLGKGDMLYLPVDASDPRRVQGAFVGGDEIVQVVEFWKQQPPPENSIPIEIEDDDEPKNQEIEEGEKDSLINDAIDVIRMSKQASVSNLQRKMKIGYARAGRIMDQLEKMGLVGPADGSKPRQILIPGFNDNPS